METRLAVAQAEADAAEEESGSDLCRAVVLETLSKVTENMLLTIIVIFVLKN